MMRTPWILLVAVACAPAADAPPATEDAAPAAEVAPDAQTAQIGCVPAARMAVAGRASPYDSVEFKLGGQDAQVCYGRPYAKGRTIFGGLVKYGSLWRTGANEPTILQLSAPASVAGVAVGAGSYSLYTIPGEAEWTIIVNRSTSQWGHEGSYTPDVEAQEVGRGTVTAESIDEPVEQFGIRAEAVETGVHLVLEWERTRVRIPVSPR